MEPALKQLPREFDWLRPQEGVEAYHLMSKAQSSGRHIEIFDDSHPAFAGSDHYLLRGWAICEMIGDPVRDVRLCRQSDFIDVLASSSDIDLENAPSLPARIAWVLPDSVFESEALLRQASLMAMVIYGDLREVEVASLRWHDHLADIDGPLARRLPDLMEFV